MVQAKGAAQGSRTLLAGLLLTITLHATHGLACMTALPVIVTELGGRAWYGLFFSAYLLASIVGLVWGGIQVDRRGPRWTFAWGLTVFGAGLAASGLAPSMPLLVGARVLEGFGGGVATTVGYAAVTMGFPASERPRVLALRSAAWVLPALVAPPVAGAVAELASWRWIFLGLLPAVVAAAALAIPSLGRLPTPDPRGDASRGRPLADALRLAAGVGAALGALGQESVVLLVLGAVAAAGPLQRLLGSGLLRARPGLPAVLATKLLLTLAFFGVDSFVPLALTEIQGVSAATAGLVLSGAALSWTLGSGLAARFAERLGPRALACGGLAILTAGIASSGVVLSGGASMAVACATWAIAGLGIGITYNTVDHTGMSLAPRGREGAASSALGIADSLGFSVGAGLGGALLGVGERAAWETASSLSVLWLTMGAIALLALASARRIAPASGVAAAEVVRSPAG